MTKKAVTMGEMRWQNNQDHLRHAKCTPGDEFYLSIWKWLITTIALQFSLCCFRTLELWLVLKEVAVGAKESLKLDFSGCTDFRRCRKNCTVFFVISASPECQPREYSESACTVIKTAHWTRCQSGTPHSLTFQGNDRPRVRGSN